MATKKYGYNQYKPAGQAGMDIVDAELNRYSPAFDYLSGFVTRSQNQQVDDDRDGTVPPPSGSTPPPSGGTPPPSGATPPPYSSEFATEQDAKDYINQYYQSTLGRDANFGTTTDDTDASYWLKNFASGGDTKSSFESNVKLGDEYKNRLNTVNQYVQDEGRNPTEQELDAIVNPGGSLSSTGNTGGSQFLTDYATKISAGDNTAELDAAVTSADDITDADEKYKYDNMSQGVKDIYSMGLNVGDTQAQTTQTTAGTTKTSTVDQAIKDAYQLLGRDPDKEGYDYWAKQLKADPTFDLSKSFKLSPEYKIKNPT